MKKAHKKILQKRKTKLLEEQVILDMNLTWQLIRDLKLANRVKSKAIRMARKRKLDYIS